VIKNGCQSNTFYSLLILFDRRTASKSASSRTVTEATTKKPKKNNNQTGIYELAADVTGTVDSLDKNGRLVSTRSSSLTTDDVPGTHAEAAMFGGYDSVSPVQVSSRDDSKSESPIYYNEVGAGKTGGGGKGNDGVLEDGKVVYDTPTPVNVGDDEVYANATAPAPSASAAATGQTQEPICTSINDFTLIDNVIYNQ